MKFPVTRQEIRRLKKVAFSRNISRATRFTIFGTRILGIRVSATTSGTFIIKTPSFKFLASILGSHSFKYSEQLFRSGCILPPCLDIGSYEI